MNYPHQETHDPILDMSSQWHKLSIHTMEDGFEIVSFSRILTIKQLNKAVDERVAYMLDDLIILQVNSQDEFQ